MEDTRTKSPERAIQVSVERVTSAHAAALDEFFRVVWGARSGSVGVEDATRPAWVCLRDGEVIGYLGSFASPFRLHGATVSSHWLKGFWVLPEFQSGPVGYMLLRSALRELGPVAVSLVALPARRLMAAAGVSDRAVLFNRLLLLRPARVLSRIDPARVGSSAGIARIVRLLQALRVTVLMGALAAAGLSMRRLPMRLRMRRFDLSSGWNVDSAMLDQLWVSLEDQVPVSPVRDSAALFARYRDDGHYELLTVRSANRLAGWAVLRHVRDSTDERLAGLRVASLSDLLFPLDAPDVGRAVVLAAEQAARTAGADALICSGTHPVLEDVLRSRGFMHIPANLHLMARDHGSAAFATRAEDFWITRGDGRSDEGF